MAIQDQFTQILGRAPTAAELEYLSKFIQEGILQEAEIGQILQSSPEYRQTQLDKDTTAFGARLQASDDQVLARGAEVAGAEATSRFAGLGRPNSSALAASVYGRTGQMAGDLAARRSSALANFYGQGLRENASMTGQRGESALARGYGIRDRDNERTWIDSQNKYWYNRQQNDFNNALPGQATRNLQGKLVDGGVNLGFNLIKSGMQSGGGGGGKGGLF